VRQFPYRVHIRILGKYYVKRNERRRVVVRAVVTLGDLPSLNIRRVNCTTGYGTNTNLLWYLMSYKIERTLIEVDTKTSNSVFIICIIIERTDKSQFIQKSLDYFG